MKKKTMKKKKEAFSSPTAKRAEIEKVLAIAQKITDAGYGDIYFTCETEEIGDREEVEIIK